MDDDEDFDFDAIDRLEQNALAARQTINGAQNNQQFAPPPQSYPVYHPPNNASTSYYQPPNQHGWNGSGHPMPWQQQQQQWQPPLAAQPGQQQAYPQQQQQPYQAYNTAHPPGQIPYNGGHQQQNQQQYYGWQQQQQQHHHQAAPPPPNQASYHNQQQQQWNAPQPPPAPQGYGYPPPAPQQQQQQQQQGNAWQPVQRPSVWQPNNHLPPPLPAAPNTNNSAYNNYQQQPQQNVGRNTGGAYSGAPRVEQKMHRQQPQQQHQVHHGASAKPSGSTADRAQRDLYSLWGVPKQQQQQPASNMQPPLLTTSRIAQKQQNQAGASSDVNISLRDSIQRPDPHTSVIAHAAASNAASGMDRHRNRNGVSTTAATTTTAARAGQLIDCETTTGCLKVDPDAAQNWIYPLGVPEREYQLSAISTALLCNTLVCLPTGLGKTLIAAVVMHNFSRWFPESKVVFVAPTKPLVAQQIEACRRFMGLSSEATAELTGRIKAEERKALWQDEHRQVFFCTPQTFYNDVKLGVCPYDAVSCVVVDECHRATGQSEIAQTLRLMRQKYKLKFRVLGLSATPGSSVDQVQEVLNNLGAAAVHFRNEEDPDVSPYVHKKITELVIVEPESENNNPRTLLLAVLQRLVGHLAGARFYFGPANAERVTRLNLLQAQNTAKEAAAAGSGAVPSVTAQEWFRQATVLADVRDSLDKYGILPTAALVRTKLSEERCIKALHTKEPAFAQFVAKVESAAAAGGGSLRLAKLVEMLRQHFEADGTPGGVIVFASLRESVQSIIDALKRHEPLIRARSFVGQGGGSGGAGGAGWGKGGSTSGGGGRSKSGTSGPGMNQKEQKEAIKGFSNGQYNVLVATCIGEEGLDIPAVDLILCYDATASPTRAVQRRGRTGRHREGKVVYLLGSGREEQHYHRIKEATTQLHSQLRQAERYFELVLPGPRMLPRQYNPEKLDVDSGYSDSITISNAAKAMEVDGGGTVRGAAAPKGGRGRGRGGGRGAGRGRGPAQQHQQQQPAGAGVLAMLEAGAIRLAEEGPRYPRAPASPLPSQPGATQFDSPAWPHPLLFPDTSSAFIRPGSNGRRLAIAPPPPMEVLVSAFNQQQEKDDGNGGGGEHVPAEKVPTPLQPRRLRFLPELNDDGSIILPCGRTLQHQEQQSEQQPAWAFLAAAIARPPQPRPEAIFAGDSAAAAGVGGSKKRKTTAGSGNGRGRKAQAVKTAAAVPQPTPPAAVLALAHAAKELVAHAEAIQAIQPHPTAAVEEPLQPPLPQPPAAMFTEAPEVIDLVNSEEQPGNLGADGGNHDDVHRQDQDQQEQEQLFDDIDIIESSSQPAPPPPPPAAMVNYPLAAPASTAATKTRTVLPEQEDDDIPLAKRMRMLRGDGNGANAPSGAGLPASNSHLPNSVGAVSLPTNEPSKPPSVPTAVPVAAGTAIVDDYNNYDVNVGGDGYFYDDYGYNGGFEEDELWEEWNDEEAMAAAAEVEREREEKERQRRQNQPPPLGGPRRRNIITSQSPGSTQPVAAASPHLGSENSSLPSAGQQRQQQHQQQQQQQQQRPGLTRLRKAGTAAAAGGGQRDHHLEDIIEENKGEIKDERVGAGRAAHKHQHQGPQPRHHRPGGRPFASAARFLDTEAQLSGDDSDGNELDGDLDGYESDFIDDGTQGQGSGGSGAARAHDGVGGGGGGGGFGSQEDGSFGTPRDHASLAAFHYRRLHEERNSPSPGSLLRRLQRARLGRHGGVAGASGGMTPSLGTAGGHNGLSAPYVSDDYDREDSFIDDGDGEDDLEEGFDTPAGRESHADECCACNGDQGELLLCDACPAAFHLQCVGLRAVPIGDWFCPVCADSNTPCVAGGGGGHGGAAHPQMAAGAGHVAAKAANLNNNSNRNKLMVDKIPKHTKPQQQQQPPPTTTTTAPAAVKATTTNKRPLVASDSDDDFA